MPDEVELTIVTLQMDAHDAPGLLAVLSKYVVLTRTHPGCRNVDLCASVTVPGRYLVIQKWESPTTQRAHFDSADMVEMARSCEGLLSAPPVIDLWDGASAHDLRCPNPAPGPRARTPRPGRRRAPGRRRGARLRHARAVPPEPSVAAPPAAGRSWPGLRRAPATRFRRPSRRTARFPAMATSPSSATRSRQTGSG